jgi:N6-adenosine-specific RNA methylase IME4
MPKTIKPPKSNLERDMRQCVREVMTDHRDDKVAQEVEASGGALAVLGVDELKPHPKNPRIGMREDVIQAIAASVREHGFHDRHAITVRKTRAGYQIISGHHRVEAARRSGLDAVPAWVIEMDDDQAYMALAADNLQGEMTLVELAIHAAGVKTARGKEGDGVKAWAEAMSRTEEYAHQVRKVGRYLRDEGTKIDLSKLRDKFTHVLAAVEAFDGDELNAIVSRIAQGELRTVADVKREAKRAAVVESLDNVSARQAKELAGEYDVIVIDPPWPMEKIEREVRPNQVEFDYPTMDEAELAAMKIPAADDCHLWLWTTHRFLPMALRLLDAWGLKYVCTFVWHKPGGFQPIGLPQYNCEFALYARRGTPQFVDTKSLPTCFTAPRGKHSEKPEDFYDVVRRVTAGRRIDIFNRRCIEGFDTWGKEAAE